MAQFYLSLEGIRGDVTTPPYSGWIEVLSFSFAGRHTIVQFGHTASKASAQPFDREMHLTIPVDKSAPALQLASVSDTKINTAQLVSAAENGAALVTITMTNVFVPAVQFAGRDEHNQPLISVTLEFESVTFDQGHLPAEMQSANTMAAHP